MHNPDLLAKGLKCGLQSSGHFGEVFCHRYAVYNWEKQEGKNEETKQSADLHESRTTLHMSSSFALLTGNSRRFQTAFPEIDSIRKLSVPPRATSLRYGNREGGRDCPSFMSKSAVSPRLFDSAISSLSPLKSSVFDISNVNSSPSGLHWTCAGDIQPHAVHPTLGAQQPSPSLRHQLRDPTLYLDRAGQKIATQTIWTCPTFHHTNAPP
ncbi:hypothetical protein H5410_024971 [Solanum commersonii]|uniref:Uncharacterized protein n=1 Tax=Solanum commersonii TaxID=4109 RepID=A0A9J5YUK7_SOLCO|nr:hypothetical protein H5410_024971 [Solanum commersonii]